MMLRRSSSGGESANDSNSTLVITGGGGGKRGKKKTTKNVLILILLLFATTVFATFFHGHRRVGEAFDFSETIQTNSPEGARRDRARNAASTKEDASSSSSFAVGGYRGGGGGGRGAKETSSENEDEAKTTFAAERQREKTGLWIKRRKNTSPESRSDYRVHHCLSRAVAVAVAVDDGTEGVGKRNKESLRWNTSVRKVRAKCARTAGACPREAMIRKGRFGTDWNP